MKEATLLSRIGSGTPSYPMTEESRSNTTLSGQSGRRARKFPGLNKELDKSLATKSH